MFYPVSEGRITPEAASQELYDAVIVGAGISGAIIAKELAAAGLRVLILEAGPSQDYSEFLARFYATAAKDNQSPYPVNPNAPMPRSTDAHKLMPGQTDATGYLVQHGPFSTDTTYTRVLSGTTMHWEAKVLRMLPQDFKIRTQFGQGLDWPIGYDDLEPFYRMAEGEIGVSGDVEDQEYLGIKYPPDYVLPMHGMPLSYLDRQVAKGIDGTGVELMGERFELKVRSFPQGRNGVPNPKYDGGKGYVPLGAVKTHQAEEGGRCQGNNNCVPICPVRAKYNAGKTLGKALQNGQVHVLDQTVACKIEIDHDSGRVSGIDFKKYHDLDSPAFVTGTARGKVFVLCANAVENPRLMLASGLQSTSGLVGRNFMDHAYLLNWALLPDIAGTMRGTNCTGGIVALRGGAFRRQQAAFSVDIHNDGWGWCKGSPVSDLVALVDQDNKFGPDLRRTLADRIPRQLLLATMLEVLPNQSNRIAVDPAYTDRLGNMRPVVSYEVPEYTMRGAAYARQFARLVFQRLGAADHTAYDPGDYGYVTYESEGYVIRGGNHLAGTHLMGTARDNSVVNADQRSWDHENLYLAGGGSMPTIGTANVTLTIAALGFKTAKSIVERLRSGAKA